MLRFHPVPPDRTTGRDTHPDRSQAGATDHALILDPTTLAIFGATNTPPPATGNVLVGASGGAPGSWMAVAWEEPDSRGKPSFRYFGLLGIDNIVQLDAGPIRILSEQGGSVARIPPLGGVELDPAPLIESLRAPPARGAKAIELLQLALARPTFAAREKVRELLSSLLGALSQHSGFIEIVGRPECGGLLIQGWSCDLDAGERTFLVDCGPLASIEGVVGTFARGDLLDRARGVVAYFKDAGDDDPGAVRRVYFGTERGFAHLDLVDNLVRPEPAAAVAQLGQLLPSIDGDAKVHQALRRVCRPRFEGMDTVHSLTVPVRAAVDRVFHVPGAGIVAVGWMADPRHLVRMVLLKSTASFYRRIHETWHRTPRRDVSEGFASDPNIGPWLRPGDDQHGFLVFVPREEPLGADEAFYIELVLADESCAFVPIAIDARAPEVNARELLGSVSIDDPALDDIVARHVGPAASAALALRSVPKAELSVVALGAGNAAARITVVIPVEGDPGDLDISLARLADDADFDNTEIVLVAERSAAEAMGRRLHHQMEFYGLHGRLVMTAERLDRFEALELGARHAQGELLLFFAPTVFPQAPGWLSHLIAELDARPEAAAISPTLLYEDFSIRFAGEPANLACADGRPRLAGYPSHWLPQGDTRVADALAEECCLVRTDAFVAVGGFSREFAGPEFKAVDFALKLRQSGADSLWTPNLALFGLDAEADPKHSEYWLKPARKVDAWRFAAKWSSEFGSGEGVAP